MQAMQSSIAWESGDRSGQFAALRHVAQTTGLMGEDTAPVVRGSAGGVAAGAGLAHDVGNLLGALRLYSDLLALPGVLREEHRAYAAELRLLSERSRAMVGRLVHHARTEQIASPGVGTVLPEVVERCRGLLGKVAGQAVRVSYGAGAFAPVSVPVESVERILTNLVKNAAQATQEGGLIAVSVDSLPAENGRPRVVLTVSDAGRGMNPAEMRQLMQADGSVPAGGRGLGFRVVRELVAMSGGCLNIESQVDVGTSISAEWYEREEFDFRAQADRTSTEKAKRARAC